jgi:uncharacterized membrane protein YqjE
MSADKTLPSGLIDSVQRLFATLVAVLHNRLELLAIEVEEEKRRLLRCMAWGAAAILLSVVSMVFLALFVTALLWDAHRLTALAVITVIFIGSGALAWWQARAYARSAEGALASTLDELLHDYASLTGRQVAGSDAGRKA